MPRTEQRKSSFSGTLSSGSSDVELPIQPVGRIKREVQPSAASTLPFVVAETKTAMASTGAVAAMKATTTTTQTGEVQPGSKTGYRSTGHKYISFQFGVYRVRLSRKNGGFLGSFPTLEAALSARDDKLMKLGQLTTRPSIALSELGGNENVRDGYSTIRLQTQTSSSALRALPTEEEKQQLQLRPSDTPNWKSKRITGVEKVPALSGLGQQTPQQQQQQQQQQQRRRQLAFSSPSPSPSLASTSTASGTAEKPPVNRKVVSCKKYDINRITPLRMFKPVIGLQQQRAFGLQGYQAHEGEERTNLQQQQQQQQLRRKRPFQASGAEEREASTPAGERDERFTKRLKMPFLRDSSPSLQKQHLAEEDAARRGGMREGERKSQTLLRGMPDEIISKLGAFEAEDLWALSRQDLIDICGLHNGIVIYRRMHPAQKPHLSKPPPASEVMVLTNAMAVPRGNSSPAIASAAAASGAVAIGTKRIAGTSGHVKREGTPLISNRSSSASGGRGRGPRPMATSLAKQQPSKEPKYSRKENSLGTLCARFMQQREACATGSAGHFELNESAAMLGARRRRMYDIVNILESVGVVTALGRDKCVWHGAKNIGAYLSHTYGVFGGCGDDTDSTSSMERSASSQRRRKGVGAGKKDSSAALSMKKRSGLGQLTKQFVQMFFRTPRRVVSFDDAASYLCRGRIEDEQLMRSTKRRLYDIINVLVSAKCISKIKLRNADNQPGLIWCGAGVFPPLQNGDKMDGILCDGGYA